MSDQINRNTMQVLKSVNTPDYPIETFLNISGKTLPKCDMKYWKIVDEQVVEMTIAEKAVIDYAEPVPEPTLEEYKTIAQDAFKAEAKEHINSVYSPEIQRSAALHVYPFDTEMTISEFVSQCVAEENRCYDAVEAAMSIEEVDAVTATWTEVV